MNFLIAGVAMIVISLLYNFYTTWKEEAEDWNQTPDQKVMDK